MLSVGSMFSGIGLLDYGLHLAGLHHSWMCERDSWRRGILAQRFPDARLHDDVRHVGAGCGYVDLIAGGFPCKGASTAGKRTGFGHPETVLWREMARAIRELRPRYVLVENVANILALHDGALWGEVLGDLATLGFGVVWDCVPAAAVGAPHLRDRVFAIASHPDRGARDDGQRVDADRLPGRAHLARAGAGTTPDPDGVLRQARNAAAREERPGRRPSGGEAAPPTDARGDGVRQQPEPEPGCRGSAVAGRTRAAASDDEGERRREAGPQEQRSGVWPDAGGDRAVAVEWGAFAPAIRRWEHLHGAAPLPLVRRMDDRGAQRVERSRLSALGDGVQVQVGYLAGAHIVDLERERLKMTPTDRLSA